jgi:hypothetical protein
MTAVKKQKSSKEEKDVKSLKVSIGVHTKLKVHVATSGESMTEFADSAILEKLAKARK